MKGIIISFLAVFVGSLCLISLMQALGLVENYKPYPYPTGVAETTQAKTGTQVREYNVGEINVTDMTRPPSYVSDVRDKGERHHGEFMDVSGL